MLTKPDPPLAILSLSRSSRSYTSQYYATNRQGFTLFRVPKHCFEKGVLRSWFNPRETSQQSIFRKFFIFRSRLSCRFSSCCCRRIAPLHDNRGLIDWYVFPVERNRAQVTIAPSSETAASGASLSSVSYFAHRLFQSVRTKEIHVACLKDVSTCKADKRFLRSPYYRFSHQLK